MKDFREKILAQLRKPEVCDQRALLLTEAYQRTEDQPPILRRAVGFSHILKNIDLCIEPWQIVVGNFASKPFRTSVFPEYSWKWIMEEMENLAIREGDKFTVRNDVKKRLSRLSWWEGKSIQERVWRDLPEETKEQLESGVISSGLITSGIGQYLPGYEKILRNGLNGIRKEVKEKLSGLNLSDGEDVSKKTFYESLLIVCEGIIHFAKRYARLASEMSKKSVSLRRRKELEQISRVCSQVPARPASSFHEAVQSFWFLHLFAYVEIGGAGIASGRLDQFLSPYFVKDIQSGCLTPSSAKRILRSLWVNFNQILTFYPEKTASIWAGYPMTQQPTLGGMKENGKDGTNELSRLILEVEDETRLPQPDIAILYHPGLDRKFFERACRLLPHTMKPKFFNQPIALEQLKQKKTGPSEMDKCSNIGCVTTAVPGTMWGPTNYGFVNLAKCLELALNNGQDPLRGKKVGPETGKVGQLTKIENIYDAYCKQVGSAVSQLAKVAQVLGRLYSEHLPLPYASIMVEDCIEEGRDVTSGGARHNIPGLQAVGIATVADGLYALKELVFEKRMVSLADYVNSLRSDFSNQRKLHRAVRETAKYGNDIEEVDLFARRIGEQFCEEVKKHKSSAGFTFYPALYSISAHAGMGYYVGATPDGRRSREPLADGISPGQGRCQNGPTAAIKSVCRINHMAALNGTLLNMKFNAGMIHDPDKRVKFMALIDAFMELGGYHVQFNIIDTEMLKEAQKHPEKYPDLLVRVAAYVAQFAILPKRLQDDIIARSELGR